MSGEKLLPCWHCGDEPKVMQADHPSYTPHGEGWYVICKCGATLGYHGTDELYMTYGDFASEFLAIEAWNTRVAVTDHDFAMAVHDGRAWVCVDGMSSEEIEAVRRGRFMAVTPHRFADACALLDERHEEIQRQQEHIAKLTVERDAYFEMVKRVQADCDARDELIRDMLRELRGLNDGGIPTDCMEHEQRMRELGIEV